MELRDADLLFTRNLLDGGCEEWKECSECWICDKHNRFKVHMDELKEIQDIVQLSEIGEHPLYEDAEPI